MKVNTGTESRVKVGMVNVKSQDLLLMHGNTIIKLPQTGEKAILISTNYFMQSEKYFAVSKEVDPPVQQK